MYCVDARGRGAPPTRLTHLGVRCDVVGWDSDLVLFRTSAEQPMAHQNEIWTVAAGGGRRNGVSAPSRLGLGPCDHAVRLPDGSCVLGRHTADPAHTHWKGYAGGAVGQLWHVSPRSVGAEAACARVCLPSEWNVGEPWFYGGRIYFVSDHDGVSNIYSIPAPARAADASDGAPASVVTETAQDRRCA